LVIAISFPLKFVLALDAAPLDLGRGLIVFSSRYLQIGSTPFRLELRRRQREGRKVEDEPGSEEGDFERAQQ
jgi:hypothetical protein